MFLYTASHFSGRRINIHFHHVDERPSRDGIEITLEQMKLLANTDSLTGLYNRRYFTESAQREFIRARCFNHSASVLFADLDHFKDINDTYGHSVGNTILIRTSNTI